MNGPTCFKEMLLIEYETDNILAEHNSFRSVFSDVLDVNAFEIRGREFSIRGVYPLTAMMNSVCNPNTQANLSF